MRVLVAGASGFIGSAVVQRLRDAGVSVVAVSRTRGRIRDDVEYLQADVAATTVDATALGDLEAVVNLVGIAIERGTNTFEAAHIHAVDHLLAAAAATGTARFIHVSVVQSADSSSAYHRTKREGEARIRQSDRDWTILRPGLVYGPGDAMLSNLVRFVRLAPVFAIPGGECGPLQTVDVRDVAEAVLQSLQRSETIHQTLDIVGPQRTSLPKLIGRVSRVLGLRTLVLPFPRTIMRIAAAAMERTFKQPPITPTQLGMLIEGLEGDVEHTRSLGIEPRELSDISVVTVADVETPLSLRLLPDSAAHADATRWSVPLAFPVAAIILLLASPWIIGDVWLRMLSVELALVAALMLLGAPIRSWLRPRCAPVGLAAAAIMLAGGFAITAAIHRFAPAWMDSAAEVYAWATHWPLALTLVMLPIIVAAEDLVWRFGLTVGLVQRFGPGGATCLGALAFAGAHATTGPPILVLAALMAGAAWSALAVRTRSWIAVALCHLAWDVGMLLLAP